MKRLSNTFFVLAINVVIVLGIWNLMYCSPDEETPGRMYATKSHRMEFLKPKFGHVGFVVVSSRYTSPSKIMPKAILTGFKRCAVRNTLASKGL